MVLAKIQLLLLHGGIFHENQIFPIYSECYGIIENNDYAKKTKGNTPGKYVEERGI